VCLYEEKWMCNSGAGEVGRLRRKSRSILEIKFYGAVLNVGINFALPCKIYCMVYIVMCDELVVLCLGVYVVC
jgi:hypothetical protein